MRMSMILMLANASNFLSFSNISIALGLMYSLNCKQRKGMVGAGCTLGNNACEEVFR